MNLSIQAMKLSIQAMKLSIQAMKLSIQATKRGGGRREQGGRFFSLSSPSLLPPPPSLTAWFDEHVLQRPNPFVQYYKQQQQQQRQEDEHQQQQQQQQQHQRQSLLPPWTRLQPHHAHKATTQILADYQQQLSNISRSEYNLTQFQQAWRDLHGPLTAYQQCLTVLAVGTDPPATRVQWQAAHANFLQQYQSAWHQHFVQEQEKNPWTAQLAAFTIVDNDDDDDETFTPTQQQWLRYWQDATGATTSVVLDNLEWKKWQTSLYDIRNAWYHVTPQKSRTWLPLWYSYLGSRQALARNVYNYPSSAVHAMTTRGYANPNNTSNNNNNNNNNNHHLHDLHEAIITKVVPIVVNQNKSHRQSLTRQRMVSLDAALLVLQQLCRDVLGMDLDYYENEQESSKNNWHPDVRVMRIKNDQTTHVVYLDLLGRPGKPLAATAPLPSTSASVVFLALEPPVWDADPVLLHWHDLLALFHEMGHVLQQASGKDDPSWPLDWAEVLPKFMEQWLWEPSTLQSLVAASGVDETWNAEMQQDLYQQARQEKAEDLMQQAFFGATEGYMMGDEYNVQDATETVMALTRRMASRYVPHAVPHATDFSALYSMAEANIRDGLCAAFYRYIWAEAVAAQVFCYTKRAYHERQCRALSRDALRKHVCQPSSWKELTVAFDLSADEIDPEPLLERYQLK